MSRLSTACENCRYAKFVWRKGEKYTVIDWKGDETASSGRSSDFIQCRLAPPVIPQHPEVYAGWPSVERQDWCASYVGHDGHGFDNPDHPQMESF